MQSSKLDFAVLKRAFFIGIGRFCFWEMAKNYNVTLYTHQLCVGTSQEI